MAESMQSSVNNTQFGRRHIIVRPIPSTENNHQLKRTWSIYGIKSAYDSDNQGWIETFWYLIDRYGQQTTVHGLDRICQRKTGRRERFIWTLGFIIALYLLASIYALVSERYRRKQFKTVVNETIYPIYKLPFPEVVICNANRLNWARLNDAMDKFLAPKDRREDLEHLFTDIVSRYDNLTLNSMNSFEGFFKEQLEDLNHINFTNVVDFMAWRCDEILWNCTWRWKSVNCCDIFFPRRTLFGQCLAFNTILTPKGRQMKNDDRYWPLHYGRNGRGSGLTVAVLLNEKFHFPNSTNQKGVLYVVQEPIIYTDYIYTEIRANNIAHVAINGILTYHDDLTRSVSSKDRDCVFDDERNSKDFKTLIGTDYKFENCFYECQRQHMLLSCNCTMDLFFPPSPQPICQLVDIPCLALNYDKFNNLEALGDSKYLSGSRHIKSKHCNCLLSCHSLILDVASRSEPQKPSTRLDLNDSSVELDFFWRSTYMTTYKTSLVFSWLDLLVSFGGIASLLLGCSLMSIVELLYFLLCDAPDLIWKKRNSDRRLKELKTKNNVKTLLDYDRTH